MAEGPKALLEFIEGIPDDKLTGLPTSQGAKIYTTVNFRLDMQGVRLISF